MGSRGRYDNVRIYAVARSVRAMLSSIDSRIPGSDAAGDRPTLERFILLRGDPAALLILRLQETGGELPKRALGLLARGDVVHESGVQAGKHICHAGAGETRARRRSSVWRPSPEGIPRTGRLRQPKGERGIRERSVS